MCFTDSDDMAHRGLTDAVLYAKDLRQLVQFYTAVAGLDLRKIEAGFAVLGREPSQLVIVQIPKRIAAGIQIATPPERREDTPIKLVFAPDDIAGARSRAAELGGTMNAVEREWEFEGAEVCDGSDPEGNVFQIRQTRP
jgi:predicted enzyme related to lactoylglutathione lyase